MNKLRNKKHRKKENKTQKQIIESKCDGSDGRAAASYLATPGLNPRSGSIWDRVSKSNLFDIPLVAEDHEL